MKNFKSEADIILENLEKEGKVICLGSEKSKALIKSIENDFEIFRKKNEKKIARSREELSKIFIPNSTK